jgi:hypothetical protein
VNSLFFAPKAEEISQGQVRLFRIAYSWRRYSRTFNGKTIWFYKGTAAEALSNFTKRNPHVTSCRVLGEVL